MRLKTSPEQVFRKLEHSKIPKGKHYQFNPPLLREEERVIIIPLTLQSDVIHSKYLSTDFWQCSKTPIFIDFFGVLSAFQRERYV